jgi:ATP-binding cassette subfamily B (MDR/TAP) protein 1
MDEAREVSCPLAADFKLSKKQCPSTEKMEKEMQNVPYASAVRSLMYAMVCTWPDIAQAVSIVRRFMSNPRRTHWEAMKWILRYLRGSTNMKLCFGGSKAKLIADSDSDLAGDIDGKNSTSGYLVTHSGGAVAWQSRLQKCVALNTTEAKFIAVTKASKELLWLKRLACELGFKQDKYMLFCDNQSAIHLSKNASFHSRSKHIEVRYHWIRNVLNSKELQLDKVHTHDNGADMLTKVVTRAKLEVCRRLAGMTAGRQ